MLLTYFVVCCNSVSWRYRYLHIRWLCICTWLLLLYLQHQHTMSVEWIWYIWNFCHTLYSECQTVLLRTHLAILFLLSSLIFVTRSKKAGVCYILLLALGLIHIIAKYKLWVMQSSHTKLIEVYGATQFTQKHSIWIQQKKYCCMLHQMLYYRCNLVQNYCFQGRIIP